MRFVDQAKINIRAGKGGNGCVSFRREKYVPKGGPEGGDGGKGGDIYLRSSVRLNTLYDFHLKRFFKAENGENGSGKNKHGRSGQDLIIDVPLGTMVYKIEERGEKRLLADLTEPGQVFRVARGGRGGLGNVHYKSSVRQTPRFAQSGEKGEEKTLILELKVIADIGLIGLPNAGKSTFLNTVSAAKSKIASYPFTTLIPHLGVVQDEVGNKMIVADIPGLISGAHQGYGLGDRFLKHIARTKFLVHILSVEDISFRSPWSGFDLVNSELEKYDLDLVKKEQIKVINKIDLCSKDELEILRKRALEENKEIYFISIMNYQGVDDLLQVLWQRVLTNIRDSKDE